VMSDSVPEGATHFITRRGHTRFYKRIHGIYYYHGLVANKWIRSALYDVDGPDYLKNYCTELSLETIMDSFLKSEGKS